MPVEPGAFSNSGSRKFGIHAPGIGFVQDEDRALVE